jgi:uncharacterized protein (TIGR03435 family)
MQPRKHEHTKNTMGVFFVSSWLRGCVLCAIGIAAVVSGVGAVPAAQTQARPAFEVASIKPQKLEPGGTFPGPIVIGFRPGGRFLVTNATLQWVIADAYGIPRSRAAQQISGGPKWINSDLFSIEAKAATDWPREWTSGPTPEMFAMVRSLLGDRFKLIVHTETKDTPVYSLVLMRRDGRIGPQLRSTPPDCAAWLAARGRPGAPPRPPVSGDRPCGVGRVGRSIIARSGTTMSQLADLLSSRMDRIVRDRTGLAGHFDLDLQWMPEQNTAESLDPSRPGLPAAVDTSGPSLFTALQEQLGLKMESSKDSVDVLVIDHAEKPTED